MHINIVCVVCVVVYLGPKFHAGPHGDHGCKLFEPGGYSEVDGRATCGTKGVKEREREKDRDKWREKTESEEED